jgi:RNase P/RNase MRP subunit p29
MKWTWLVFVLCLLLVGCAITDFASLKKESNVGKTVTVSGEVKNPLKIGSLSGYTLVDEKGNELLISSEVLPKDGARFTVKGELVKDTLMGYYVRVD